MNMQFLVYGIENSAEASAPPTEQQLAELGKLNEDGIKSGVLVATGGASATGTRLRYANGKFSVTDGPFIEAKELTGGFAILQTNTLEEAVEWAKRFRSIIGEGESEIVRIFGPHDYSG
jgi:hypothetical protein